MMENAETAHFADRRGGTLVCLGSEAKISSATQRLHAATAAFNLAVGDAAMLGLRVDLREAPMQTVMGAHPILSVSIL